MKTDSDKSETVAESKSEATLAAPSGSANPQKEYAVIQFTDIGSLISTVNECLKNGWELQGGVCAVGGRSTGTGSAYYHQALWRYRVSLPNVRMSDGGRET